MRYHITVVAFVVFCFSGAWVKAQERKLYLRFAESEMQRFPEAWQIDHGKRLYFGYGQGLGCLAMLKMWEKTGDQKYFDYVETWADTIINRSEEHTSELQSRENLVCRL